MKSGRLERGYTFSFISRHYESIEPWGDLGFENFLLGHDRVDKKNFVLHKNSWV